MSRGVAEITVTAAGGTRTVRLVETNPSAERAPGDSVAYTMTMTTTGLTPPPAPTTITLAWKDSQGGSLDSVSIAAPQSAGYRFLRFPYVENGAPVAGTLEIDLRIAVGGVTPYDVSTDGRGTQTGGGTPVRERHWQRATTSLTVRSGLGLNADGTPLVAFGDDWRAVVALAAGVGLIGSPALTVAARDAGDQALLAQGSTTFGTGVNSVSVSLSGFVGNPMTPRRSVVALTPTFQNHPVSGQPSLVPSGVTVAQNPDVDPRITVTTLVQANDNTFGTPPLSKDNGPERLTADLSFLAARLTNARGEGENGVAMTRHLYDGGQLTGTPAAGVATSSNNTATLGGEAGWTPGFLTWDEVLPGGTWFVRNTATGAAAGLLTPVDSPLTLVAADPNLVCVAAGGPGSPATDSRHFTPGEPFVTGLAIFHVGENMLRSADPGSPKALLARFSLSTGQAEVLQADLTTWTPAQNPGSAVYHDLAESFPGSRAYILSIPGAITATWADADVFTLGKATVGGVPVAGYLKEVTVAGVNNHTAYEFDALAFLGIGGER